MKISMPFYVLPYMLNKLIFQQTSDIFLDSCSNILRSVIHFKSPHSVLSTKDFEYLRVNRDGYTNEKIPKKIENLEYFRCHDTRMEIYDQSQIFSLSVSLPADGYGVSYLFHTPKVFSIFNSQFS